MRNLRIPYLSGNIPNFPYRDRLSVTGFLAFLSSLPAHAAATGGLSQLETPITTISKSLTGPVALAVGLIGMMIAGGMLIFGGELGDWGKRMTYLGLVLALVLTANQFIPQLFPQASAVIGLVAGVR
jgi:type IV secretion system protein VirB2